MEMSEKIKPCPFCGANVFVNRLEYPNGEKGYYTAFHYADCFLFDNPACFDSKENLIEAWNRRAKNA